MLRRVTIVLALLIFAGCGRFASRPSSTTPVIVISIDTLRSDHLPAYGYKGVHTPNIDALRADSILYERAYSHCPLTLPSHATILTGRLPAENGLRDNVGFRLNTKIPTLAELLKKNGYATGAAISAFVLRRESGIDRGFDFYDDDVEPLGNAPVMGRVQRRGTDTVRIAENWIDQHDSRPFFFFLHLYEPHTPYAPPEPFWSRYSNHYDGEIAYVDQIVGDFLRHLKDRGIYEKALIVLLSDHGEGLNEHGEEEHGIFLYREALQVPLLLKLPRSRSHGDSVSAPAALADVFPTILLQTATPEPSRPRDGGAQSLLVLAGSHAPPRSIYSETYYPRFHFGWSDLHSLVDGRHHLIRAPIPELYDLAADPGERKNTIDADRRVYTSMRAAIEPMVKKASAPANIDPEEAAKLAALGYVGSTVTTAENEVLPDPKDTIGVFLQIRQAYTYYRDGKQDAALALTDKLLDHNARIMDLWDLKTRILSAMGRNDEAIEAGKAGLRQQPTTVSIITTIANLSLLTGKLDQAQQHAELLLPTEPARAHEILSRIAVQRSDFGRAREEAKLALQDSHDPSEVLLTLGLIEKQQHNLPQALSYFDEAAVKIAHHHNKRLPNLHLYRGDVLARLGREAEAEKEFRTEIAQYPNEPDAYGSLILLLSTQKRLQEATQLVFDLIKVSPRPSSYVVIAETLKAIGDKRGAIYWAYQGLQKYPANLVLRNTLASARGGVPERVD